MRTTLPMTLLFALIAVSACDRDEPDEADDAAPAAEVAAGMRVTDIELSKAIGADNRPTSDDAETDDFRTGDPIYVSVDTEGAGNGTLYARWTSADGQLFGESSQTISPAGPAVTAFQLNRPEGLPAGNYKVEIRLNGQPVASEDFEVKPKL